MVSAAAFETIAVATAMPEAVRDVNGLKAYAWAFTALSLAALVATVVGGDISDRRGPRLPLIGGLGVFTLGLVTCATAQTMPFFVAGRLLQGLGGGAAIVAVYVVVARGYDERLRPQLFSVMAGAWVVPSLIGPVIAGSLTQWLSWRWVFWSVIPLVGLAVWAVGPIVRSVDGPPADHAPERSGRTRTAFMLALGALLVQDAGRRLGVLGALEALVGLGVMIPTLSRLLPRGTLLARPGIPAGIAARGLLAGAFFGAEAFLPLMLHDEHGISLTVAGLTLTSSALGWFAGSWWQGREVASGDEAAARARTTRERWVLLGAVAVTAAIGGAALSVVLPWPVAFATLAWTCGGFGMGVTVPSVNVQVLSLSRAEDQGANSAALQVGDGVGTLLCTTAAGAIYAMSTAPIGAQAGSFIAMFVVLASVGLLAIAAASRLPVRQPAMSS